NATYLSGSCTPTCYFVGNTITWDLNSLAAGASGSKTYKVTVSPTAANNDTVVNAAEINSSQNDANFTDNQASVTTTVRVPSISGIVLDDLNNNGADDDGGVGLAGAMIKLFRDGNGNGTFDGAPTDPQVGTTIVTDASGGWTFSGAGVVP